MMNKSVSVLCRGKSLESISILPESNVVVLVKEVVSEAIKVLTTYNRTDARSAEYALHRGVNFLKDNFDLWEDDYLYNTEFGDGRTEEEMEAVDNRNKDEWRIKQFNRNRDSKDQVSTLEELENKIKNL